MTEDRLKEIKRVLLSVAKEERQRVFQYLREEFPIHALEKEWNATAELILEAIARAPDLTQRGVRGVIAEAAFNQSVVGPLISQSWKDETPTGDHPFDFQLIDKTGPIKVQVKMQRREKGIPKIWKSVQGFFVVETQKTRSGTDSSGKATRPYRFGEFDILAVSLQASLGDWSRFRYTVASWLLPRPEDATLIRVFQPVPSTPNRDWCDDFLTAVAWFRQRKKKTIKNPA